MSKVSLKKDGDLKFFDALEAASVAFFLIGHLVFLET